MLTLFITILCFGALANSGPIPNNPINASITNIESFFEHSLGNLAGNLISHHNPNSTEHYQSLDGSLHADVAPINLSLLQGIAFHPSHHQLVVENETILFQNSTEEVSLIKVDLGTPDATDSTVAIESTAAVTQATTEIVVTEPEILKLISTTIVSGTTEVTKIVKTTASTTIQGETSSTTTNSTPVVIVTPENKSSEQTSSATSSINVTSSTTGKDTKEPDEDISDKIKEVEAEPVILTNGV